ncbi:chlorohydrolase [Streptococcus pneumoniae]|nr:chlorohydrolase [Streptococcus pneumoniae]
MKIKVQTRKLAAGCSKHCFKVVDGTDEVSSKHCFEVVDRTDEVSSKHCFKVVDRTDEVSNHIYGKVKLTWFEEIFEEYKSPHNKTHTIKVFMYCPQKLDRKNLTFWGQYIQHLILCVFLILKIFYNFF